MEKVFVLILVIISVLAAVCFPLITKQNTQANDLVKTTVDQASSALFSAIKYRDLEGNATYDIDDLVYIKGKNWSITTPGANNRTGTYSYTDPTNHHVVATIDLTSDTVLYTINCAQLNDTQSIVKCCKLLNGLEMNRTIANITLKY